MQELYPLKPYAVEKVWGGSKLAQKVARPDSPIGETWEVSALEEGPSTTQTGVPLHRLNPAADCFGPAAQLEYLVKFIDTSDDLSIQVHPDDEYAQKVERGSGKTECWTILDAEPGAGIYLGFKPGVEKVDFLRSVKQSEAVQEYLNFYPVEKGDFYYIPAGSIHAIGKGVYLAEVQQSSGITYRVWDWNRMGLDGKPRELHLKHALEVLRFEPELNTRESFRFQPHIFQRVGLFEICRHPQFILRAGRLKADNQLEINLQGKRAESLLVLSGEFEVRRGNKQLDLPSGEAVFIPYKGSDQVFIKCLKPGEFLYVA